MSSKASDIALDSFRYSFRCSFKVTYSLTVTLWTFLVMLVTRNWQKSWTFNRHRWVVVSSLARPLSWYSSRLYGVSTAPFSCVCLQSEHCTAHFIWVLGRVQMSPGFSLLLIKHSVVIFFNCFQLYWVTWLLLRGYDDVEVGSAKKV